jgi:hypothetical protein
MRARVWERAAEKMRKLWYVHGITREEARRLERRPWRLQEGEQEDWKRTEDLSRSDEEKGSWGET